MKNYTKKLFALITVMSLSLGQVQSISAAEEQDKKKSDLAQAWTVVKKTAGTLIGGRIFYSNIRAGIASLTTTPEMILQKMIEAAAKNGETIDVKTQKKLLKVSEIYLSKKSITFFTLVGALILYKTWSTELRDYLKQKNEPIKA